MHLVQHTVDGWMDGGDFSRFAFANQRMAATVAAKKGDTEYDLH